RAGSDLLDQVGYLVDMAPVGCRPAPPLAPIDGPKVTIFIGPLVPDLDPILLEPAHICVPAQEPQKLTDDRADMQLLGGEHRQAVRKIEPHLIAENRARAGSRPIGSVSSGVHYVAQKIEILLHEV